MVNLKAMSSSSSSSNGIMIMDQNRNLRINKNFGLRSSQRNPNPKPKPKPMLYGYPGKVSSRRSLSCQASLISGLNDALLGKTSSSTSSNIDLVATVQIDILSVDLASHALLDLTGQTVKLSLVSLDLDPATNEGKRSSAVNLEFDKAKATDSGKSYVITLKFTVPKDFGKPGALVVDSDHENEFLLMSVTVELADGAEVYFPCHSWIQDVKLNQAKPRIFFTNQVYLPSGTPEALKNLRAEDLELLRGDGKGLRKTGERIYDYDVYNDLGNPDVEALARPNLGGNADYLYPRRCRTGRPLSISDPTAEISLIPFVETPYIPRDEYFSPTKQTMFALAAARRLGHDLLSALEKLLALKQPFPDFDAIHDLYVDGLNAEDQSGSSTSIAGLLDLLDSSSLIRFPIPGVVAADTESWCSDQEFGRQRVAGVNPMCIQRLTEFPIRSSLDEAEYGAAESAITREDLERYLDGLTVEEAIEKNKLYILDYHDAILPLVNVVNEEEEGKVYAARTIFHLTDSGFLRPIAIELTLPPNNKSGKLEATKRVLTMPSESEVDWEWRLAKTHVSILDGGVHELVSHWLRTHACVEPFVIATNRHLSTMHPLFTFLRPHFKDTMYINAMARSGLIRAGGIIELGFSPGKYSMRISSLFYKGWRFDEQALPKDLIKRGIAVEDPAAKHGLKLLIEDYPYAQDGLDLWAAIEQWTKDYVGIYYETDEAVAEDTELQAWWKEIREVGHGDHAEADWWLPMNSVENLCQVLTTLVWITSGHHAAVNFGQYAYFGYMPNIPSKSRQLIPERETPEYKTMLSDPESFFLSSVSYQGEAILVMAIVELLSQHLGEEEYIGDRSDPQWTNDPLALGALDKFQQAVKEVDKVVEDRVASATVNSHRLGPVKLPYTLLAPSSGEGITFRGVPNSISI